MPRPAYLLCLCPDSGLLHGRLESLATRYAHPTPWQRHIFWGDEGLTPLFWEHLTLQGLFDIPRMLIVRCAQNIPVESLRRLSPFLEQLANGRASLIWPVLCLESAFERDKAKVPAHIQKLPFYLLAEQRGWIDSTPPLNPASFPKFLREEAARAGFTLNATECTALTQALPPDAAHAAAELARLALMTDASGRLPRNALDALTRAHDMDIFALMRSLQQRGDTPAVWRRVLEDRLGGDNSIFAFIAILLREGRILWQTLCGSPPPMPPQMQTAKKILAQSLGFAGLAKIWELALLADKGIKTGERSPEQTFEILTADLFLLFSPRKS